MNHKEYSNKYIQSGSYIALIPWIIIFDSPQSYLKMLHVRVYNRCDTQSVQAPCTAVSCYLFQNWYVRVNSQHDHMHKSYKFSTSNAPSTISCKTE